MTTKDQKEWDRMRQTKPKRMIILFPHANQDINRDVEKIFLESFPDYVITFIREGGRLQTDIIIVP